MLAASTVASAAPITLHPSDLDIAGVYADEAAAPEITESHDAFSVPALSGLSFSTLEVISPTALDLATVAARAQDSIEQWTGASTRPFDANVAPAAWGTGSTVVPADASAPAEIIVLSPDSGPSVAPMRGPLAPDAIASAMPTTLAGVASPSVVAESAALTRSEPPAVEAPPPAPDAMPLDDPDAAPARSGPSLLTIVALAALVVTGATTIAMQSDRAYRPRRHHSPRDF